MEQLGKFVVILYMLGKGKKSVYNNFFFMFKTISQRKLKWLSYDSNINTVIKSNNFCLKTGVVIFAVKSVLFGLQVGKNINKYNKFNNDYVLTISPISSRGSRRPNWPFRFFYK